MYDAVKTAKELSIKEKQPYIVFEEQDEFGNWEMFYMAAKEFDNFYEGLETGEPYPYCDKELFYIEDGEIVEEY